MRRARIIEEAKENSNKFVFFVTKDVVSVLLFFLHNVCHVSFGNVLIELLIVLVVRRDDDS